MIITMTVYRCDFLFMPKLICQAAIDHALRPVITSCNSMPMLVFIHPLIPMRVYVISIGKPGPENILSSETIPTLINEQPMTLVTFN